MQIELEPIYERILRQFVPFYGTDVSGVVKHAVVQFIEQRIENAWLDIGLSEANEKPDMVPNSIKDQKPLLEIVTEGKSSEEPSEMPSVSDGFRFRTDVTPFEFKSLPTEKINKTSFCIDYSSGKIRILRNNYFVVVYAYIDDIRYLYSVSKKEVRQLIHCVNYNKRPLISGFLKDVPFDKLNFQVIQKLHEPKLEIPIKNKCSETSCANKDTNQCSFCTDKSRYIKLPEKTKKLRQMVIKMGLQ